MGQSLSNKPIKIWKLLTPATKTIKIPNDVNIVYLHMIGSGGRGGSADIEVYIPDLFGSGGGGGGAGQIVETLVPVTPGGNITVQVGAANQPVSFGTYKALVGQPGQKGTRAKIENNMLFTAFGGKGGGNAQDGQNGLHANINNRPLGGRGEVPRGSYIVNNVVLGSGGDGGKGGRSSDQTGHQGSPGIHGFVEFIYWSDYEVIEVV